VVNICDVTGKNVVTPFDFAHDQFTFYRATLYMKRCVQFSFAVIVEARGETEVADLDLHRVVEKEISELEVAMYHVRLVKVGAR